MIDFLPLWVMFLIIVITIYITLIVGFKMGVRSSSGNTIASVPPISSVVASMLGLLAFLLALTFNSSATRYEARKLLLLDDANAINKVYLWADFLASEDRLKAKALLKEYVEIRIQIVKQPELLQQALLRTNAIQAELWGIQKNYFDLGIKLDYVGKFTDAVVEMIDVHNKRVAYGIQYRIHSTILFSLFGVGLLSLGALGYQFGISGGTRYHISLLLALCFGSILLLILDLDRPAEGSIKVDQLPLYQLLHRMQ
ncbi:MAG: hypothetical protein HRU20_08700 [Pseudomonadales bacterium]|nr:hypothetical protein [Pseudomonadales bacterium]